MLKKLTTLVLATALNISVVCASDFEDGLAAHETKDFATALRKFKSAAAQGDARAQSNIGLMFHNGQGVVQDYAESMRWYKLAAAQGHSSAQFNLGIQYDNGQGVAQDYAEAVRWYKLASAQGNISAQLNLGFMYSNGQGVVQDYIRAHMWYNLAALKGDAGFVKNRDIVAARMTAQQIAEAQKLARECQARNFKNCD
jgi:TPR repeat protein